MQNHGAAAPAFPQSAATGFKELDTLIENGRVMISDFEIVGANEEASSAAA